MEPRVLLWVPQESSGPRTALGSVPSNQAGSAVHHHQPGARDGGGDVHGPPPAHTLHIQHLHSPDHTELQVRAGGDAPGHHHLGPPALRELDTGVVHPANLEGGDGSGVELGGVVSGGNPPVVHKVIEMNVRGGQRLRVRVWLSKFVQSVRTASNYKTWNDVEDFKLKLCLFPFITNRGHYSPWERSDPSVAGGAPSLLAEPPVPRLRSSACPCVSSSSVWYSECCTGQGTSSARWSSEWWSPASPPVTRGRRSWGAWPPCDGDGRELGRVPRGLTPPATSSRRSSSRSPDPGVFTTLQQSQVW